MRGVRGVGLSVHLVRHHALKAAHRPGEGKGGEGFGKVVKSFISLYELHDIGVGRRGAEDSVGGECYSGVFDVDIGYSDLVPRTEVAPLDVFEGGSVGSGGGIHGMSSGGSSNGSGCSCCGCVAICAGLLLEQSVDALSADIHLLGLGFGDPVGVGFANHNVGLVWGPGRVELENDTVNDHSQVISIAHLVMLSEILEGCVLKSLRCCLLMTLEVVNCAFDTFGNQREKILLPTY